MAQEASRSFMRNLGFWFPDGKENGLPSSFHTWQAGYQGTLIAFLPSMMNHTWQAMHRGAPDTNLRFPCWATSQTL